VKQNYNQFEDNFTGSWYYTECQEKDFY